MLKSSVDNEDRYYGGERSPVKTVDSQAGKKAVFIATPAMKQQQHERRPASLWSWPSSCELLPVDMTLTFERGGSGLFERRASIAGSMQLLYLQVSSSVPCRR
jgi:hypothetical protein